MCVSYPCVCGLVYSTAFVVETCLDMRSCSMSGVRLGVRLAGASTSGAAAGKAADDDGEEGGDGVDDALEDTGNAVDDSHDSVADGAEAALDL